MSIFSNGIFSNSSSLTSSLATNKTIASSLSSNVILPKWNNALARAKASGRGARVLIVGDSTDVSGISGGVIQGWSAYLANYFTASGFCYAGYECTFPSSNSRYGESRVTIGSSWTLDSAITSIGGGTYKATTNTNAFTFTPSSPCDVIKVYYVQQSGGGVISVDYAGLGTTTQSTSGTEGIGVLTLNTGSAGLWAFNIKWSSGGQVNLAYIECYNSGTQETTFMTCALGGSGSIDWQDTTHGYSWLNAMVALVPDVVIMGSVVNDMGGTLEASQANMTKIIQAFQGMAVVPDILMRTCNPQNPTDGTNNRSIALQDSFVNMTRTLATTYGCQLVDVYNSVISYANGSTLPSNFYIDTWVHPSLTGVAMVANEVAQTLMLSTGAGAGYYRYMTQYSFNSLTDYKIGRNTFIKQGAAGCTSIGINAFQGNSGAWNISVGDNTNNVSGGFGNTSVGYNALSTAGFKLYSAIFGYNAGALLTSGSYNTLLGAQAASTVLTTGARNVIISNGSEACTTPASGTNDYINIDNTIKGYSKSASNGGLSILGVDSLLGVLIGANFNITTDNTIPIAFCGTKYMITKIIVTNASISLTTAIGGVYTATSKGGTALVSAAQTYAGATAATKVVILTLTAGATADTFALTNLYLNLTTAQGAAATGDIFVYGIPLP